MFPYSRLGFKLLKVRGYSLQPLWSIWYQEKNHDLVVTPLGIFLQTGDPIGLSATLLSLEMTHFGGMLALHSLCPAQRVPVVGDVQTT